MTPQSTLIHAAELLEREAQILAENMCDPDGEWEDPHAEDDHADMLQTARALRDMAETPRNPNTGHGHVYPRPDGVKARCGGPGLCAECSRDAARDMAEKEGV